MNNTPNNRRDLHSDARITRQRRREKGILTKPICGTKATVTVLATGMSSVGRGSGSNDLGLSEVSDENVKMETMSVGRLSDLCLEPLHSVKVPEKKYLNTIAKAKEHLVDDHDKQTIGDTLVGLQFDAPLTKNSQKHHMHVQLGGSLDSVDAVKIHKSDKNTDTLSHDSDGKHHVSLHCQDLRASPHNKMTPEKVGADSFDGIRIRDDHIKAVEESKKKSLVVGHDVNVAHLTHQYNRCLAAQLPVSVQIGHQFDKMPPKGNPNHTKLHHKCVSQRQNEGSITDRNILKIILAQHQVQPGIEKVVTALTGIRHVSDTANDQKSGDVDKPERGTVFTLQNLDVKKLDKVTIPGDLIGPVALLKVIGQKSVVVKEPAKPRLGEEGVKASVVAVTILVHSLDVAKNIPPLADGTVADDSLKKVRQDNEIKFENLAGEGGDITGLSSDDVYLLTTIKIKLADQVPVDVKQNVTD